MPKQKTKSSVTKRVKVRKSGTVTRGHAMTSHMFNNKSQKQKRKLRKSTSMNKSDIKRYKGVM